MCKILESLSVIIYLMMLIHLTNLYDSKSENVDKVIQEWQDGGDNLMIILFFMIGVSSAKFFIKLFLGIWTKR